MKTTWTYDAQIIPDVPDDPNMAFQRILKENIIVESLIISDLDWRHFGMYIVDAVKDGCKETLTFHIMHEKGIILHYCIFIYLWSAKDVIF